MIRAHPDFHGSTMLPSLWLFRTSYFLFLFFLLLFFFLSPFLPRDPTKVAPLNGPRHIASAVSRVDGECFEWVLKHEASACHRPRTTRILAHGEKTRVKRRERVRQWGITRWITSASYVLYPLTICNLDFIIDRWSCSNILRLVADCFGNNNKVAFGIRRIRIRGGNFSASCRDRSRRGKKKEYRDERFRFWYKILKRDTFQEILNLRQNGEERREQQSLKRLCRNYRREILIVSIENIWSGIVALSWLWIIA